MSKRIWIGFFTVFVTTQVIEGLVDFYVFDPIYSSLPQIWRPINEVKFWMLPVGGMFFSYIFVLIFSKGYEKKGILEGVRFGLYVALMVILPFACSNYALMQIPYSLALQWFILRTVEYVIAGAILSGVFMLKFDASSAS